MKKNIYKNLRKSVAWFTTLVSMHRNTGIKTSLLLLATVAGFSLASLANNSMLNHDDTVKYIKTVKQNNILPVYADTCCTRKKLNPANKNKGLAVTITGGLSVQGSTMIIREKVNLVPLLKATLLITSANADEEVFFNFKVSQLHPSVEVSSNTDIVMIQQFTEEMVAGLRLVDESSTTAADAELTDHFMTMHFSVQMNYADIQVKADSEMMQVFETANPITIALPSEMIFINADAEMTRAMEQEKQ